MSALHALPRLLWRPAMLLWLAFPVLPSIAFTMSLLDESGVPVRTLWEGGGGEPALAAAWRLLVLLSAAIGIGVSLARMESEQTTLAWTLPGLRRGLFAGTLLVALIVAAGLAVLVSRSWESPGLYAAAFGLALSWFALASVVADGAFSLIVRWSGILAILATGYRPLALAELAAAWPWVVGAGGMLAAVALMLVQFSARAARSRILTSFDREARYWSRWQVDRSWTGFLATERLFPWMRGAAYESTHGQPLWLIVLFGPVFVVFWAHLANLTSMATMLAAISFSQGRLLLSPALLHPLSRRRRATIAVTGSALHAALFVLSMAALALAVEALGVPPLAWFSEPQSRPVGWGAVLLMTFAWSPVVLWGPVRWPGFMRMNSNAEAFKGIALMVPYASAAMFSVGALERLGTPMMFLAAAATAAVVWGLFALAVRWHYARADLVPRPA
jgi:hypothetical protein